MTGVGASVSNLGYLNVGFNNGGNATLLISNGGQVTSANGYIGGGPASVGVATVTGVNATGTASTWSATNLSVGTGTLNIDNRGIVNVGGGWVGCYSWRVAH